MKSKVILHSFTAMVKARTMEFVRDRGTFFWNLLFPVLLVFGFSFAFSGEGDSIFTVGTIGPVPQDYAFIATEGISQINYEQREEGLDEAIERVRRHQVDMLLDFSNDTYYVNSEAQGSQLLLTLFTAYQNSTETSSPVLSRATVNGQPIRYVDWLVPGVIGMNMMFSCLFGVGFVLVRYRKNGVLKRMKATPVSAINFISAQAASRLIIVFLTSIVVYSGTNIFLNFMMNGNYLNLLLITTITILCMISLGLVFASRIKSEELASGLLNLVTFPMLIFSGVFFSLENSPQFLRTIAKIFPLTHFIDGARAIMLDGAGIVDIIPNLLYLIGLTVIFLLSASFLFKWE